MIKHDMHYNMIQEGFTYEIQNWFFSLSQTRGQLTTA